MCGNSAVALFGTVLSWDPGLSRSLTPSAPTLPLCFPAWSFFTQPATPEWPEARPGTMRWVGRREKLPVSVLQAPRSF